MYTVHSTILVVFNGTKLMGLLTSNVIYDVLSDQSALKANYS